MGAQTLGTVSGSVSLFNPPFLYLMYTGNRKSLNVRTLCVKTAYSGDTVKFGTSCAVDFCITTLFLCLTSSPIFFHCRQMLGGTAVIAVPQFACEIYTHGCVVHRYPACDRRDLLVHGSESFQVSEVSPYVCGVYRWWKQ